MKKALLIFGFIFLLMKRSKNEIDGSNNPNSVADEIARISDHFVNNAILYFGITGEQILNSNRIIDYFFRSGHTNIKQLAYILATAWHESFLKPIEEFRAAPGTALYDQQNTYWDTGFYGRGFVQLTFESNYIKMSSFLNIDLVNNPSLALDPDIATKIIVEGMTRGVFTGKSLNQYINNIVTDFFGARRVVNGTDKAELIKGYANLLLKDLI